VDQVRRREHKQLKAEGDERLTGTKYDWLRNPAAMGTEQRRDFAQLRQSELKTARAWALKETAMRFFSYVYEKPARQAFSVVVQLGSAKSIRTNERKSGDAEEAIRKHHHLLATACRVADYAECSKLGLLHSAFGATFRTFLTN